MFYSILPHFKLLLWIGYEEPWYNSKCSLLSTVWTLLSLSPVVKCEPPKPIPNGQPRPPVNEMYEYGQAVQYVCNGDNTMLGASDTVHCLENGSWSDVPRCASKLGSSVGLSWLYRGTSRRQYAWRIGHYVRQLCRRMLTFEAQLTHCTVLQTILITAKKNTIQTAGRYMVN